MKSFVVLISVLLICNSIFSQKKETVETKRESWFESQPIGFVFVPQGSYTDTSYINSDTIIQTISIAPFWMSNEITNKEYREFVNYLNLNPQDSLCYYDWKKAKLENSDNSKIDKEKYRICKPNKEIVRNIIDTTQIVKDKADYVNYFSNKKYNDFPVVGVSYQGAIYFGIWKTKMEKVKGNRINDYRIPGAEEWKYVRSLIKKEKGNKNSVLQKSVSGIKNELMLYNLSGNVSEWTSSAPDPLSDEKRIIMGGSWKTKPDLYEKTIADKKEQFSSVGFRLVRSFIGSSNN
jgi:formylglycine-generating enzyme required for sulfatase activity